jgi:hypothetical protein
MAMQGPLALLVALVTALVSSCGSGTPGTTGYGGAVGTASNTGSEPPQVVVEQVRSPIAGTVDNVARIASLQLDSGASLPVATRALGAPDRSGRGPADPTLCYAWWDDLGLEAIFWFAHPPSFRDSCRRGPLGAALMTGDRWRVVPSGLAIGDSRARARQLYPDARAGNLVGAFTKVPGRDDSLVLATGAYGGQREPILYATFVDDRVASLVYLSLAD